MGGLGNQLFQIFTTLVYSFENRCHVFFHELPYLDNRTDRPTYWNTFLRNLRPFLQSTGTTPTIIYNENPQFRYRPLPSPEDEDDHQHILLYGYFQSPLYFQHHYSELCEYIGLDAWKEETQKEHPDIEWDKTVSLHFRWGDYKRLQGNHPILTLEYYTDALNYITTKDSTVTTILYFCEDDDHEQIKKSRVSPLSAMFPHFVFRRGAEREPDWKQMLVMSSCKHNIIANSTFSWWGAYFGFGDNQIVCYPSTWFGPQLANKNVVDLFPPHWIKV
jgi:hypothetical protein